VRQEHPPFSLEVALVKPASLEPPVPLALKPPPAAFEAPPKLIPPALAPPALDPVPPLPPTPASTITLESCHS
jgi:hypothetical protein